MDNAGDNNSPPVLTLGPGQQLTLPLDNINENWFPVQDPYSTVPVSNSSLDSQVHEAINTIQFEHVFYDDTLSVAATGISYLESVRTSASRGGRGGRAKRKDRNKPYKAPTSAEFGTLADTYDVAKLIYAADRLLDNTYPELDQKREIAQRALNWAAIELNINIELKISDRGCNLLFEGFGKRNNHFKRFVESLMLTCYGFGKVDINGNLILSPAQMKGIANCLLGVTLELIWCQIDKKGLPIPFLHPILKSCLQYLYFTSTGKLGIRYREWFGGRYPQCGIAYSLAMMELVASFYETGEQRRVSADREALSGRFRKWLDIVDLTERHDYYGGPFEDMNYLWFGEESKLQGCPIPAGPRQPRPQGVNTERVMTPAAYQQIAILWYLNAEGDTPQQS